MDTKIDNSMKDLSSKTLFFRKVFEEFGEINKITLKQVRYITIKYKDDGVKSPIWLIKGELFKLKTPNIYRIPSWGEYLALFSGVIDV